MRSEFPDICVKRPRKVAIIVRFRIPLVLTMFNQDCFELSISILIVERIWTRGISAVRFQMALGQPRASQLPCCRGGIIMESYLSHFCLYKNRILISLGMILDQNFMGFIVAVSAHKPSWTLRNETIVPALARTTKVYSYSQDECNLQKRRAHL